MTRFSAILLVASACQTPTGEPTSVSMKLRAAADLAADIASLRLTVFADGTCAGGDASGDPLPNLSDLILTVGEARTIRVPSGTRTFSVVAYDASLAPIARACETRDLEGGGHYALDLTLAAYPPGGDAGPDAALADAGPADAPGGPDDCASAGTLAPGQISASLAGLADDAAGSCGGAGGTDAVFTFTVGAGGEHVTLTATAGFDGALYVQGLCGSAPSESACATSVAGQAIVDLADLGEGTYAVWVDRTAPGDGSDDFTLRLDESPPIVPPPNDACADATDLGPSGTTLARETLVDATDNLSGSCAGAAPTRDVFYHLHLDQRSIVDVSVSGTTLDTSVTLLAGCGAALACSQTSAPGEAARFRDVAPGDYQVLVDGPPAAGAGPFDITWSATPVPDNNSCAAPATLTPGVAAAGTTMGATNDLVGSCGGTGGDVVYGFHLDAPSRVVAGVTTTSGDLDPVLYVRAACADPAEPTGACADASAGAAERLDLETLPAGDWFLVVDAQGTTAGAFTVTLTTPAPAGDACAAPVDLGTLTAASTTLFGQHITAAYAGDFSGSCGGGGADRVYRFAFTGTQQVTVTTSGDVPHAIYVRDACGAGADLACQSGGAPMIDLPSLAGGTYYLYVDTLTAGVTGTFSITITLGAPATSPPNDVCPTATTLLAGFTTSEPASTLATANDDLAGACGGGKEVFYKLTVAGAPRSIAAVVSSAFDTGLTLLDSGCTELACVDATPTGETLNVPVLAPGDYYLAVEDAAGSGAFTVGYTEGPPRPANDTCAGAPTLAPGAGQSGTTVAALDDVTGGCGGAGADVAYRVHLDAAQRVRLTVSGASFDPVIVLDASCGGAELACGQASTASSEVLDVPSLPAGDYVAWVDGGEGAFSVLLELLTPIPPPPNDTCASPDILTANPTGTLTVFSTAGADDTTDLACLASGSRDTFHRFSLGATSAVLLTATPSSWPLGVELRGPGTCTTTSVSCVADGFGASGPRRINRPSLAGGTYDVAIDGAAGASGSYTLKLETRAADTTFGYWLVDNKGSENPALFVPLAGGTAVPGFTPNDGFVNNTQTVTLPFDIDWYGTRFAAGSTLTLSENLYATLATPPTGSASYGNDCPLDATTPSQLMALFWDYGYGGASATLTTKVEGSAPARRFVIEWKNWSFVYMQGANPVADTATTASQQLVLYENGDVEMIYGPRSAAGFSQECSRRAQGCSATIGLEGLTGATTDVDGVQCATGAFSSANDVLPGRDLHFVHPR